MPVGITDPPFTVTNEDTFPRCFNRQAAVIRQASDFKASLRGIPSLAEVRPSRGIIRFAPPLGSTELRSYNAAVAGFCLLFVWFSRLAFGIERHATRGGFTVSLLKGQGTSE